MKEGGFQHQVYDLLELYIRYDDLTLCTPKGVGNPNQDVKQGLPMLCWVIKLGAIHWTEQLLKMGADPDRGGPLFYAIQKPVPGFLSVLLRFGANRWAVNEDGQPLEHNATHPCLDFLRRHDDHVGRYHALIWILHEQLRGSWRDLGLIVALYVQELPWSESIERSSKRMKHDETR
jgi:hypothetical protein